MLHKDELIQKLFHDQCSQSELEHLLELIKKDDSETSPEVLKELFQQLGDIPNYEETIFARIQGKIDTETNKVGVMQGPASGFTKSSWILKIAASFLLLASLGWLIYEVSGSEQIHEQTASGEIKHIQLPDGSSVSLNGNSSLRYAKNWESGETRKVYLEGEAFFEVEKKPRTQAKFQVLTEGLRIEVLGTSFNVNNRKEATSVFLEEGKVKIKLEEEHEPEVFMKPGEIVHYSIEKKALTEPRTVSGSVESSWKTGILEFEAASIEEILNKLAEFNDFQFDIRGEELEEEKLTISIPGHNMEVAMSVLEKTSGTSISKVKGIFIIKSKSP